MTFLGKLFVLLNLTLSLAFLTLAVGVFTNHLDYPGKGGSGSEALGEHGKKKAEIQQLHEFLVRARARWKANNDELAGLEKRRPELQIWYKQELDKVVKGPGPVQTLFYRAGRLVIDAQGLPSLQKSNLHPIAALQKEIKDTDAELKKEMESITALVKLEGQLTEEVNGVKNQRFGLIDLVNEAQQIGKNSLVELEYLKPLRYNRQAEAGLLLKRQRSLEARKAELQRVALQP